MNGVRPTSVILYACSALGIAFAVPAYAATPAEAIVAAVAARAEKSPADVEISGLTLPADIPADAAFEVTLPSYAIHTGSLAVKLSVGGASWSLRPQVGFWAQLPVAVGETKPGEALVLRIERRREAELHGAESIDPSLTWRATGTLHAGQVVTAGRAERVPDIEIGRDVTVVVRRGAIELRAPGRLLADGLYGAPVAVLNLATKAQQHGTLQADGTVLLGGG
ncbi:hypothetical protein LBMAG42_01600 [Deltaproteobacteria bacterium]|nr:hypothetical protein LBMAG42_01600 [Deltaproteobacteria bacterium]